MVPFIYFAGMGQRVLFNYVGDEGAYCIIYMEDECTLAATNTFLFFARGNMHRF